MRQRDFLKLSLGEPQRLSGGLCDHEHPALPPDGRHLAYYAGEYGNIAIVVASRGGHFAFTASPPRGNSTQPAWHPDGNLLLYRHQPASDAKWELWQTAIKGDLTPRPLLAHPDFHYKHPSFSPDGRRLAWFSDEGSPGVFHLWLADILDAQKLQVEDEEQPESVHIFTVGVTLGKRRQLTFGDDRMDCHPVFSPDGRRMAYHFYRGTDENAKPAVTNLAELDVASGVIRELTEGDDQYKHPFYLDEDVVTFHHEDNATGIRRLGALHLRSGETVWLSSGDKNDKHPFPWLEPATRKHRTTGRQWLYYASKREGEKEPGEPSTYDILRAELCFEDHGVEDDSSAEPAASDKAAGDKKDKKKSKPKDRLKDKLKDKDKR